MEGNVLEQEDNESNEAFSSDDSVKDPPFKQDDSSSSDSSTSSDSSLPDSSSSSDFSSPDSLSVDKEINEEIEVAASKNIKRGRKRKANPSQSIKEVAKRLRNCGKSYTSNSVKNKKIVPEKAMGAPCTDKCKQRLFEHNRRSASQYFYCLLEPGRPSKTKRLFVIKYNRNST